MKVCERERKLGGGKGEKQDLLIGMPPSFKFNAGSILVKGRLHPCE